MFWCACVYKNVRAQSVQVRDEVIDSEAEEEQKYYYLQCEADREENTKR